MRSIKTAEVRAPTTTTTTTTLGSALNSLCHVDVEVNEKLSSKDLLLIHHKWKALLAE